MQVEQNILSSCCIRVYLLGPLEVLKREADGIWKSIEKKQWRDSKAARRVFKRLLAQPGRRLSRSRLQDEIWPNLDFELADKYLYTAISIIHGIIGKSLVTTWESSYELATQTVIWTDIDACEHLLKTAEDQGYTTLQALPHLEQALAYLERGEYLEREEGAWCYGFRAKAEDMLKQCRLWLAEAYEAQEKYWQAGEQYRVLCQSVPFDENALHAWMALLTRQGKVQEALKCFQDMKGFAEARGFSLSSEMHRLFTQLEEQSRDDAPSVSSWISQSSSPSPTTRLSAEHLPALGASSSISEEALPLFATMTETCQHLSEGNELRLAEQILWTYLPKIELFAQTPSEDQTLAAGIASQGYLLAASLVGHRNDLLRRLRYSKQALHYGRLANDLNLQLVALRQTAISFDNMDLPEKVLEVSQQALPFLEHASPLLQACIYAGMSGAYAELGQKQDSLRFMERSYEYFPEHPETEPRYLHTICRYSTLIFFDGLNRLDLGEPREAEEILGRIDGLYPKMPLPERVRIELLNYQIKVFLALKEQEQASAYLEESANASWSIGSERHFQDAFSLYRQMQKIWRYDPHVRQLADLFTR